MNVQGLLNRIFTAPPLPSEAIPRTLRAVPGGISTLQLAWDGMFKSTLLMGIGIGLALAILLFLTITLRFTLPSILKAISHVG